MDNWDDDDSRPRTGITLEAVRVVRGRAVPMNHAVRYCRTIVPVASRATPDPRARWFRRATRPVIVRGRARVTPVVSEASFTRWSAPRPWSTDSLQRVDERPAAECPIRGEVRRGR
ncbi:hypothetical protein J2S58_002368 [Nakamurella flavida]|nr:hypothetical protein [Nakamurella flavida]